MATLTTQQIAQTGLNPATGLTAASGGGDRFKPGDNVFLRVKNADGSSHSVTIDSKVPSNFGDDVNLTVVVTNGQERWIGPLPKQRFAAAADGLGNITYTSATGMSVGVYRL